MNATSNFIKPSPPTFHDKILPTFLDSSTFLIYQSLSDFIPPRIYHIMAIDAPAWATLVLFFISAFFVIHPVSFHVRIPVIGRTKITIGLMTSPLICIAILWAAQCLGATQIRNGIVGTGMVAKQNSISVVSEPSYEQMVSSPTIF